MNIKISTVGVKTKNSTSRKYRSLALAGALACAFATSTAHASHLTSFGSIDAIDNVFGAGGGVFNGATLNSTDDSWLVFGANVGDSIVIDFGATGSFNEAVIFIDIGDGNIQVGDVMNLTNFNFNKIGQGNPLQVINGGGEQNNGRYLMWSTSFDMASFIAPITGQYGIGITANNNQNNAFGAYSVNLAGNTLNVAQVPEPTTLALLGLAVAGLPFRRRRKAV